MAENVTPSDLANLVNIVGKEVSCRPFKLVREEAEQIGIPVAEIHNLRLQFSASAYFSAYNILELLEGTFL